MNARDSYFDPIVLLAIFRLVKQRILRQRLITFEELMMELGLTEDDLVEEADVESSLLQ